MSPTGVKLRVPVACRRKHVRYTLPPGTSWIEFPYPEPGGSTCTMRLRDISACGISFILDHDLPGLDIGDTVRDARLRVDETTIEADLLVMHLTPDATRGSICGALLFPDGDHNIVAVQKLLETLQSKP